MADITAINTTSTALIIDDEGHVLGAWTRGPVDTSEDRVAQYLESGQLLKVNPMPAPTPEPAEPTSEPAAAALAPAAAVAPAAVEGVTK